MNDEQRLFRALAIPCLSVGIGLLMAAVSAWIGANALGTLGVGAFVSGLCLLVAASDEMRDPDGREQ